MGSITFWNRLEPRRFSTQEGQTDVTKGVQARVRDPLWLIGRQWQMGEFLGEDGGSAALTEISYRTTKISRFEDKDNQSSYLNDSTPLESIVESEAIQKTINLGVQLGSFLAGGLKVKLKEKTVLERKKVLSAFKTQYPFDELAEELINAKDKSVLYFKTMKKRLPDGRKIVDSTIDHRTGTVTEDSTKFNLFADRVSLPQELENAIEDVELIELSKEAFLSFYKAHGDLISKLFNEQSECWSEAHLEYQFSVSAPNKLNNDFDSSTIDESKGQVVLRAKEYDGVRLDWYSFDIDKSSFAKIAAPSEDLDNIRTSESQFDPNLKEIKVIPSNLEFRGMPSKNWWEFEDRQTDFGQMQVDKDELAKVLLMEFALVHSNDWFYQPLPMKIGDLLAIKNFKVTDVFGEIFELNPAGMEDKQNWGSWNLFQMSDVSDPHTVGTIPEKSFFFLPPVVGQSLSGSSCERVRFLRDEMANLVWGVEDIIEDQYGWPVKGFEMYQEQRQHLLASTPTNEEETGKEELSLSFKLMSKVPENWFPFRPVRKNDDPLGRSISFQRAHMLKGEGSNPMQAILPKGMILNPNLPEGTPYRINEEEIPREGANVERKMQYTRWLKGKTFFWSGRQKKTGRGEGASGLKFDYLNLE